MNYTGQISIKVFEEDNKLKVVIEDDGIGIKQSKKLKATSGTQKGEKILEEQITQINKLYQTNYMVFIEDINEIKSSGNGTRVTIKIPLR